MALPLFPGTCPDMPVGVASEWAMWTQSMGDGYETRQLIGINSKRQSWTLTFSVRPLADITAMDDFLTAQGAKAFGLADPMRGGAQVAVFCDGWSHGISGRTKQGAFYATLQVTLRRAYGYDTA